MSTWKRLTKERGRASLSENRISLRWITGHLKGNLLEYIEAGVGTFVTS